MDCQKSCVSECEDRWEEKGGKCYFFSQDKWTWEGAEEECKGTYSSHLASVTDKQTDDFIVRRLEGNAWIGARQTFDESDKGSWAWADCSPWNYTSWRPFYTPDDEIGQECVFYDKPMTK